MTTRRITRKHAELWLRYNIGAISLPAGCEWYFVSGLQYAHQRRYLWLAAGENGLHGVYGTQVNAQAERKAG